MNPKYNGIVAIDAAVDLNGLKNTAVKIMDLPSKFVAVGMTVEQLKKTNADDTLTFESKIGTNNAVTFGKTYAVADDALTAPAYYAAGTGLAKDTAGTGTVDVPSFVLLDGAIIQVKASSSTALTDGKIGVTVYGFQNRFEDYASAGENKAPVDPYIPPEKA